MFFLRQKRKDGEYHEALSFLDLNGHMKEFINFSPGCCVLTILYNLRCAVLVTTNEKMSESQGVVRE